MKDPYGKLGCLRRELLENYDAETLHQLRIALRRMRGTLRNRPEAEAGHLRDELGLLAEATNAARDWDTLGIYAAEVLTKNQYRGIEPWLEEGCLSARQRVIRTLRSEQWSRTMEHCKHYARAQRDDAAAGEMGVTESDAAHALARLSHRRDEALSCDDAAHWHRLRIAVKDFRYQLDSWEAAEHRDQILLCKRLQDCLGRWHDCVVHDQLLSERVGVVDPTRNPRAAEALGKLRHELEKDRISSLASARDVLGGTEMTALLTGYPEESGSCAGKASVREIVEKPRF